jgi:hypothetical protein
LEKTSEATRPSTGVSGADPIVIDSVVLAEPGDLWSTSTLTPFTARL